MKTLRGSWREKCLLFLGFLGVTLGNYFFYSKWPYPHLVSEKTKLEKESIDLENKNKIFGQEVEKAKQAFEFFKSDVEKKKEKLSEISEFFFSIEDKAFLVDKVQKIFQLENVSLKEIDYQEGGTDQDKKEGEFTFNCKLEAPYDKIKELFYRLQFEVPGLILEKVLFTRLNNQDKKMEIEVKANIGLLKFKGKKEES